MAKTYGQKQTASRSSRFSRQLLLAFTFYLLGYLSASVFEYTSLKSWVSAQLLQKVTGGVAPKPAVQQVRALQPKLEFYTLLANDPRTANTQAAQAQMAAANVPTVNPTVAAKAPPASTPANVATTAVPSTSATHAAPLPATAGALANRVVAEAVAKPHAPLPMVVTAKPVVSSVPINSGKGGYFLVQVAAFKSNQEAERMKAALALKGFSMTITKVNQQGMQWYRVNLGPFATRDLALKAQMAVARSEHIVGMVRKMDA